MALVGVVFNLVGVEAVITVAVALPETKKVALPSPVQQATGRRDGVGDDAAPAIAERGLQRPQPGQRRLGLGALVVCGDLDARGGKLGHKVVVDAPVGLRVGREGRVANYVEVVAREGRNHESSSRSVWVAVRRCRPGGITEPKGFLRRKSQIAQKSLPVAAG